jgi:hypothetical protein
LKKYLLSLVLLFAAAQASKADNINFNFTAGILKNFDGSAVMPNGSLIQVIASPDTTFNTPTSTDFLGGSNDVLLWSGAFSTSGTGTPGAMQIPTFSVDLSTTSVANYYLAIRWFPSLPSNASAPGSNTRYGEYGYGTDAFSLDTSGENVWRIPSSAATIAPTFLTTSAGGSSDDTRGYATNFTAGPEPSSYAIIIALFSLGLLIKHSLRSKIVA